MTLTPLSCLEIASSPSSSPSLSSHYYYANNNTLSCSLYSFSGTKKTDSKISKQSIPVWRWTRSKETHVHLQQSPLEGCFLCLFLSWIETKWKQYRCWFWRCLFHPRIFSRILRRQRCLQYCLEWPSHVSSSNPFLAILTYFRKIMVGKSFRDLLTIRLTLPSVIMMPKKSMNKNLMEMTALFKRTKLFKEKVSI